MSNSIIYAQNNKVAIKKAYRKSLKKGLENTFEKKVSWVRTNFTVNTELELHAFLNLIISI
jgi:hypothetical protein